MTHVPDWLAHRAAVTPERFALSQGGERLTYAQLDDQASALAAWMADIGVAPGDAVALLLSNSLQSAIAIHAVSRAGAVVVPLNTRLTPGELAWQLADAGARVLLFDDANRKAAAAAATSATVRAYPLPSPAALPARAVPPRRFALEAPHSIVYTSGTTGRPKGAVLTFGNQLWSAMASAFNLGLHAGDVWVACLPFFHVGGLTILMRAVLYGIEVLVHPRFDAADVNRSLDEGKGTIVSVVATMLRRMLDERHDAPYPPTLRTVLVGGGPVPLDLLERCARASVPVVQTYGLTEACSQVCTLAPEDALRKLGSAGKPVLGVELRIVDDTGRDCPPGTPGEIWVRSPTIMAGYHGRPDETARRLRGGWLATGDIGYLDAEGYLYVLDRRDDLIVTGGENVAPAEVERVLCQYPGVSAAAVVGLPDTEWGQRVVAAVELQPGVAVTPYELLEFARERLAGYKCPREVRVLPEIPKTASGKILRRLIRESWQAQVKP